MQWAANEHGRIFKHLYNGQMDRHTDTSDEKLEIFHNQLLLQIELEGRNRCYNKIHLLSHINW